MERRLRLCKRNDFAKVYQIKKSTANYQFVVYWRKRIESVPFRMGVSISSKLGGAVVRNRIRRKVKEIVRLHAPQIQSQVDFVIIVRKPALIQTFEQMEASILHVLRRAGLISK